LNYFNHVQKKRKITFALTVLAYSTSSLAVIQ